MVVIVNTFTLCPYVYMCARQQICAFVDLFVDVCAYVFVYVCVIMCVCRVHVLVCLSAYVYVLSDFCLFVCSFVVVLPAGSHVFGYVCALFVGLATTFKKRTYSIYIFLLFKMINTILPIIFYNKIHLFDM